MEKKIYLPVGVWPLLVLLERSSEGVSGVAKVPREARHSSVASEAISAPSSIS